MAVKKEDAESIVKYFTVNGIAVVSAKYRLYPDAVFPEFVCDAATVAWTFKNIQKYGECKKFYIVALLRVNIFFKLFALIRKPCTIRHM